jgi:transposase
VCPARDTGVALVMTHLDTAAMNLFLAELTQAVAPGAHAVVLMDKAGWHIADDLVVPANITPVFLPSYSPELNPIERLWLYLKDNQLSHRVFAGPAEIIDACCDAWNNLIAETGRIRSLCSYPWLQKVRLNQVSISPAAGRPNRLKIAAFLFFTDDDAETDAPHDCGVQAQDPTFIGAASRIVNRRSELDPFRH